MCSLHNFLFSNSILLPEKCNIISMAKLQYKYPRNSKLSVGRRIRSNGINNNVMVTQCPSVRFL